MLYRLCKVCNKEYTSNIRCEKCEEKYKTKLEKEQEKQKKLDGLSGEQKAKERYKLYNKEHRDKKKQEFYSSKAWVRLRDTVKINCKGLCLRCYYEDNIIRSLDLIHHIISLDQEWSYALKEDNLIGLCARHHMDTHHKYILSRAERVKHQEELLDYLERWNEEYKEE